MNPLTNMKNVLKLSEQDLHTSNKSSWHDQYRDSAWVFVGGLPYDLTEGDLICIFSQYGEIVNINLIRDKDFGKSKGFCFMCYEDQRSTVLAVDNFNGIKILNRTVRVDHVSSYKVPKQGKKTDAETKKLYDEGCGPKVVPVESVGVRVKVKADPDDFRITLADQIQSDIRLPKRLPIDIVKLEEVSGDEGAKVKKEKKKKKKSKKKKNKNKDSSDSESDDKNKVDKKGRKSKGFDKFDEGMSSSNRHRSRSPYYNKKHGNK